MAHSPIRLALIGCGNMARAHLRGWGALRQKGIDSFRIVAVCDPVRERSEAFAAEIAAWDAAPAVYTDLDRLLREQPPDAADIVTPHHLHHTTAIACLEAGAHVLIEKPLGVTLRAARQMVAAAQRTGRILATAEQVRRWLGPRAAHWAIHTARLIGRPRLCFALLARAARLDPDTVRAPHPFTWRQDKITGGGGFIFDGGVHYADLLLYLFGAVDTVYAFTGNLNEYDWPLPDGTTRRATVEDTGIVHLTFASGVVGTWCWTAAAPGRSLAYSAYYGSHGCLYSEGGYPTQPEFRRWDGSVQPTEALVREFLEQLDPETRERYFPRILFPDPASLRGDHGVELELYDFLEAIRTGRPPELDGEAGLAAQAVVTACFESSVARRPVRVAEVLAGEVDTYQREIDAAWGLL